jgi:hypothetical protein
MMETTLFEYLKSNFPYIAQMYTSLDDSAQDDIYKQIRDRNSTLGEEEEYETTFYDFFPPIIYPQTETARQKEAFQKILTLLDGAIKEYFNLVQNELGLINQLKRQLGNLFRVNGDNYLDKIGELLSTNYLIKRYDNYKLKALEYEYEKEIKGKDSKDVDLILEEKETGNLILVDVYNLNLDYKKIENENGLSKLLSYRLSKKRSDKHFDSDFVRTNYHKAILQPFIWIYDIDTIFKYKKFWDSFSFVDTWPILCLRQRSNQSNELFFDCVEIANIDK